MGSRVLGDLAAFRGLRDISSFSTRVGWRDFFGCHSGAFFLSRGDGTWAPGQKSRHSSGVALWLSERPGWRLKNPDWLQLDHRILLRQNHEDILTHPRLCLDERSGGGGDRRWRCLLRPHRPHRAACLCHQRLRHQSLDGQLPPLRRGAHQLRKQHRPPPPPSRDIAAQCPAGQRANGSNSSPASTRTGCGVRPRGSLRG